MNIVFMGTPDFAVPALEALYKSKHNIAGVFSQPDKPVGAVRVCLALSQIKTYDTVREAQYRRQPEA